MPRNTVPPRVLRKVKKSEAPPPRVGVARRPVGVVDLRDAPPSPGTGAPPLRARRLVHPQRGSGGGAAVRGRVVSPPSAGGALPRPLGHSAPGRRARPGDLRWRAPPPPPRPAGP